MRVLLAGSASARRRLKAALEAAGIIVVVETSDIDQARRSRVEVDAIVLAPVAAASDASADSIIEPLIEPLTARERDVLALLAEGLSNKAIATRLQISDQTVKFHVASIYGKLGASNRTDAVRLAFRRGLVTL